MALKHIVRDVKGFFGIAKLKRQLRERNMRTLLEEETLRSKEPGVTDERYCPEEVVVSLTTYGERIEIAYLAIASIMHQTRKPNRIVLWLGEEEREKPLPATLDLLMMRGLEVRYCRNLKSHTKLLPALKAFPDAVIITVDDDVMYNMELIDRLVRAHLREPRTVWGSRATRIALDSDGRVLPYKKWREAPAESSSPLNFVTGVGGILYPPHIFPDEIHDEEIFMRLAPTADDLWFKAMEMKAGVEVKKAAPRYGASSEDYIGGIVRYSDGLAGKNVERGANDEIVRNLHEYLKF